MTKQTDCREITLDILMEIMEKGSYSHIILRQALDKYQYLDKQDRAFITRVTEGTLEYRITIDAILERCSTVKVRKMKPLIRTLLRMSVYQIFWMDRVPDRAVCDEAVKLAVKRKFQGLKGFVNGVLRNIVRQKDSFVFDSWSEQYSMPQWLIEHWQKTYPDAVVEQMLQAFLADIPTTVRCNLDRITQPEIIKSLQDQGVTVQVSPLSDQALLLTSYDYLDSLEAFREGWITVQDVSSGFVGTIAAPAPGDRILDVCGAPGGKSLHAADLLKGTGMVTVRDLTEDKIRLIDDNITRSGFTNIRAEVWDALEFDPEWDQQADIVLADLPCSGLGIIGKKPDIKYQVTPDRFHELSALQQEILTVVSRYVKPGGILVYSTCTINQLENEEQVSWFTGNFPFEPVDISGRLGSAVQESSMKEGYLQLLPGIYPCDGFFIAVFRKLED
ncbi:MAG: 16S rRNA (cytosine(967)-C(5))-methyltransferase RsmB [Lachnospiraceae bacterium]